MPVLAKANGIVMRMLINQMFGTHFHAFYGDCELVIGLNPLRVIQGEAPPWVREWALDWVGHYQSRLFAVFSGISLWDSSVRSAMSIEHEPQNAIQAPSGAAWFELSVWLHGGL